jgi:DNA-directed RNA polymerase, mitochondrial
VATLEGQLALEREMLQIGADAFASRMNKRREQGMESLSTHGDALAAMGVDRMIQDLRKHRHAMRDGRAGRGYAHMGPLLQLAPHKVAAVAMRVVIDQLTQAPKFQALAYSLAERLWLETMLARASEYELKSHQRVRRRFRLKRADAMRMKNSEIWTPQEKLSVGVFLVHLVESHTGLIEVYQERGAMRTVKRVRATKAALEWVRSAEEQQRMLCPFALPTIVPPRNWSDPLTGGYWTEGLPGNTLFKNNSDDIAAQSSEFDAFMVAANIQQGVAWRINKWMLDQVTHAWDRSLSIGNLLPRSGHDIPPYPKHLADDDEGVAAWRMTAGCCMTATIGRQARGSPQPSSYGWHVVSATSRRCTSRCSATSGAGTTTGLRTCSPRPTTPVVRCCNLPTAHRSTPRTRLIGCASMGPTPMGTTS